MKKKRKKLFVSGKVWKKWNKEKSVQVEDLEDMYVKNQFGIYVLDPRRYYSIF